MSKVEKQEKKNTLLNLLGSRLKIIIIVVVIVLALIPSVYFYTKYSQSQKLLDKNSEGQTLVAKVAKLIELPKNEAPTIATVADKARLAGQDFFINAQNGDKVLIYYQAKKAILYRPSTNKIVEVAPLNTTDQAINQIKQPTASPSASPNFISVALYNGTNTVGLTKKAEKLLLEKVKDIKITVKESADKDNYSETIVYEPTGKVGETVESIADIVSGKIDDIVQLKDLTDYNKAQIIVILGEDFIE